MTLAVMRSFGVTVERSEQNGFQVPRSPYQSCEYPIEPDASAASYFFAIAAVTGGRVAVEGLSRGSLQGDLAFCECLAKMGCDVDYQTSATTVLGRPLRGIDVDMNAISDTVQTLAVVALVRRWPDDDPQRRPHPPQGNRSDRQSRDRAAQAGGNGRRVVRWLADYASPAARAQSKPTTTTGWR